MAQQDVVTTSPYLYPHLPPKVAAPWQPPSGIEHASRFVSNLADARARALSALQSSAADEAPVRAYLELLLGLCEQREWEVRESRDDVCGMINVS